MRKSFGDTSPRVAQSLTLLADTYRKIHLWVQAKGALEEVVSIRELRDADSLGFASDLKNLAHAYIDTMEFAKAKVTFLRAVDIQRKQWGPDGYARTTLLNDYAAFLEKIGATDEAKSVKAEIDKITNKTVDTHVRLFSQIPAKTIEEAKRKLVVTTFEDGIHTADGFSIRCRDQRVERVEANGTTAVLRQLGATILSCDFEQETRTILVATSAKVVSLSSIGKLQEDSEDEPGTISSAIFAGLGRKIISHDYSRYDMDDEVVLVEGGKFVMVLGHVPSHSVLVHQGERIFAIAPPDSTNNSPIFEVILPPDSRGK